MWEIVRTREETYIIDTRREVLYKVRRVFALKEPIRIEKDIVIFPLPDNFNAFNADEYNYEQLQAGDALLVHNCLIYIISS